MGPGFCSHKFSGLTWNDREESWVDYSSLNSELCCVYVLHNVNMVGKKFVNIEEHLFYKLEMSFKRNDIKLVEKYYEGDPWVNSLNTRIHYLSRMLANFVIDKIFSLCRVHFYC